MNAPTFDPLTSVTVLYGHGRLRRLVVPDVAQTFTLSSELILYDDTILDVAILLIRDSQGIGSESCGTLTMEIWFVCGT